MDIIGEVMDMVHHTGGKPFCFCMCVVSEAWTCGEVFDGGEVIDILLESVLRGW